MLRNLLSSREAGTSHSSPAGLWLVIAWQDLMSYVREICPSLHLLTLAPTRATL